MSTFLEFAKATYPETVDGRSVRPPIGRSMVPLLRGEQDNVHADDGVGYELVEMRAYIRNEWKLLRLPEPSGTGNWQLYNLEKDPGEIHDVAEIHPGITAEMIKACQQYAQDNDVFDHKGRFDALYREAYGKQ
jgi:arylsulfatase